MVLSALSPEVLAPSKIRVVLSAWSPGIPSQTGSLFSMRDFRGFTRFFARNGCSISHPFFVNSEYQRYSCAFSVDILAHICPNLLLDSSSFHERCMHCYIGFQMWTCSACRGKAKDRYVFSERCPPPWFLFPLLCIAVVYDIACQCQVVG